MYRSSAHQQIDFETLYRMYWPRIVRFCATCLAACPDGTAERWLRMSFLPLIAPLWNSVTVVMARSVRGSLVLPATCAARSLGIDIVRPLHWRCGVWNATSHGWSTTRQTAWLDRRR